MVRESSSEAGCESNANARNDASEQVAGPDMGLVDTSKKLVVPPPRPCQSSRSFEEVVGTPLRKVVGETTAETMSLLSASVENFRPDNSSGSSCKQAASSSFQYHVLAVDDNRIDQRVVEKLLKTSSYKVTTVNSALRALEVLGLSDSPPASFKKLDINLIMTDYCMPEMTGYDLLKRVKAKTSALKEIPVVIMSSENDSTRIKRCLAEGAEEFIIKPVHLSDVKRLMGHIRCPSTSSSSGTGESFGSTTCGKRKADRSDDLHEVSSPERRPRLCELLVT